MLNNGFYADSLTHLATAESIDWDYLKNAQIKNPLNELHSEFALIGALHKLEFPLLETNKQKIRDFIAEVPMVLQHHTANWRLMKAIVARALYDTRITATDLKALRITQEQNGFLPDLPNDLSSQYHAYTLLLIVRFGDPKDVKLQDIVLKAFEWLINVEITYGDPNPLGRGQFQLFGYAAMRAAVHWLEERWPQVISALGSLTTWTQSVQSRLPSVFIPNGGALPFVWDGPYRENLLHGYNTPGDYPSFANFWLQNITPKNEEIQSNSEFFKLKLNSGTVIFSRKSGPLVFFLKPEKKIGVWGRLIKQSPKSAQIQEPHYLEKLPKPLALSNTKTAIYLRFEHKGPLTHSSVWVKDPHQASIQFERIGFSEICVSTLTTPATAIWHKVDVRTPRQGGLYMEIPFSG